jgi:hypothetical protein
MEMELMISVAIPHLSIIVGNMIPIAKIHLTRLHTNIRVMERMNMMEVMVDRAHMVQDTGDQDTVDIEHALMSSLKRNQTNWLILRMKKLHLLPKLALKKKVLRRNRTSLQMKKKS